MSEYITLYQERQRLRQNLKSIREKADPEQFWKLKSEEKKLTEKLLELAELKN